MKTKRITLSRNYLRKCAKVAVQYAADAKDFLGMRSVMFDILNEDRVPSRIWDKSYNIKRIDAACLLALSNR